MVALSQFDNIVRQYGGDPTDLLRFDKAGPDLLPYATLTAAREAPDSDLAALMGVYEWQDRPLIMMVDGTQLGTDPDQLDKIRHLVAMRGDAPYLAVLTPGRMTIYTIGLEGRAAHSVVSVAQAESDLRTIIPYLGNEQPDVRINRRRISDVILRLLTEALDALVKRLDLTDGDAISLVGRALFVRFLADRSLVPPDVAAMAAGGIPTLLDAPSSTIEVSKWLDDTFNGDFLPLSAEAITNLPEAAFKVTGDILRRAEDGQLHLDWEESWAKLDFAHIPVGVLSQTYERYLSRHEKEKQKKEGSYYTPRHIADLMVRASFSALRRDGPAHRARVLDPAAGAGVFLITAFRQLVAERWLQDGRRPDTNILREILENQISGFDINESALRFAALGLYLMSIELDPNPEPVEKLGFRNLRPTVLRKLGGGLDVNGSKDLGSLGAEVGSDHLGAYDLVIGNPPWTKATKLHNWSMVETTVLHKARERLGDENALAPLPNAVVDLPFVWRAMGWARENGQIAFALHARILFQRGEGMADARRALFGSVDVTGIINGAELRQTRVWPEVAAPFCLFFARNAVPSPGAGFRFISPQLEGPLNRNGGWRIDASRAELVTTEELRARPTLLKTLFRGTRLDLELYDRIGAEGFRSLDRIWRSCFGEHRGRPKQAGNGYQSLKKSSRKRKGESLAGASGRYLWGLPEVPTTLDVGILVDSTKLEKFAEERIHDPRDPSIFQGPLLLVRKAPPKDRGRIRTMVSDNSVVFKASYYGYSAHGHKHGAELVRYLALVIGSRLPLWHVLITSGEFGFERDTIEKYVIEEVLIPEFNELSEQDRISASELFDELTNSENEATWQRVDQWVALLFGLTAEDVQTISDTLDYRLPFAANKVAAQRPVAAKQVHAFRDRLDGELRPWTERFNRSLAVRIIPTPPLSPWCFVYIGAGDDNAARIAFEGNWAHAIQLSDELSATEILYVDGAADCLILGRLNQARYWSISQARLAARRIIWDHVDFLSGNLAR